MGLAGKQGFVARAMSDEHLGVGGNLVARLKNQDVGKDDILFFDLDVDAIAQDFGRGIGKDL